MTLGNSLEQLRNFVDTANAPIFGVDVDGRANEWNLKVVDTTGHSREIATQKHLASTFIAPSLRKSVQDVIDSALQGNETSNFVLEFEIKCKDQMNLLLNASVRHNFDNAMMGVAMVVQDAIEAEPHSQAVKAAALELRLRVDKASAPIFRIGLDCDFDKTQYGMREMEGATDESNENKAKELVSNKFKESYEKFKIDENSSESDAKKENELKESCEKHKTDENSSKSDAKKDNKANEMEGNKSDNSNNDDDREKIISDDNVAKNNNNDDFVKIDEIQNTLSFTQSNIKEMSEYLTKHYFSHDALLYDFVKSSVLSFSKASDARDRNFLIGSLLKSAH